MKKGTSAGWPETRQASTPWGWSETTWKSERKLEAKGKCLEKEKEKGQRRKKNGNAERVPTSQSKDEKPKRLPNNHPHKGGLENDHAKI